MHDGGSAVRTFLRFGGLAADLFQGLSRVLRGCAKCINIHYCIIVDPDEPKRAQPAAAASGWGDSSNV